MWYQCQTKKYSCQTNFIFPQTKCSVYKNLKVVTWNQTQTISYNHFYLVENFVCTPDQQKQKFCCTYTCVARKGPWSDTYSISQEICTRFLLCCGYTLTDFPISIRLTSLALWQSNDCPSASKATLMNMDKYFMWIHYERLHNHNKANHNKTVCIFLGIYCISNTLFYVTSYVFLDPSTPQFSQ